MTEFSDLTKGERFLAEIAAQLTIAWAAKTSTDPTGKDIESDISNVLEAFNKFRNILRESPQ